MGENEIKKRKRRYVVLYLVAPQKREILHQLCVCAAVEFLLRVHEPFFFVFGQYNFSLFIARDVAGHGQLSESFFFSYTFIIYIRK